MRKYLLWIALVGIFHQAAHAQFVGIPREEFQPFYSPQMEANWCWASSASMVMAYQGVPIPQINIVQHIKSVVVDATASEAEIVRAVNHVFNYTVDGSPAKIVMSGTYIPGAPHPLVLYNQLKQKKPVIMMYRRPDGGGHAVVVTGINATQLPAGILVDQLHVFEPFAYRSTPFGPQFDAALRYKNYSLYGMPYGMTLRQGGMEVGLIMGMILMNSSINPA